MMMSESSGIQRRRFLEISAGAAVAAASGRSLAAEGPAYYVPGQRGYETARRPFNADLKAQPGIIAACASEGQIAQAIRRATAEGLPIAIKSGGHSFEGFSLNDGGMVIELSRMTQPSLSAEGRFRAGPGMTLGTVYDYLLPKGRMLPAGSCSGVGLGGLTLGGGYGLFSREFGLTCDHLERVRMVDGQGRVVDSEDDPDLLWACRGGGNGHFGVITSLEFRTVEAPAMLSAQRFKSGPLSIAETQRKVQRWFAVAEQLPEAMFSACVINGKHLTALLTSTRNHTGPGFASAAKALTDAGFTASAASRVTLPAAIKRYYGNKGTCPVRGVCPVRVAGSAAHGVE